MPSRAASSAARPAVRVERCQVCALCAAGRVCRVRALRRIDPDEAPFVDVSRCIACRRCVVVCPHGALELPS